MSATDYLILVLEAFFAILIVGGAVALAALWITSAIHSGRNHCNQCLLQDRIQGSSTTVYTSDRK